STGRSKTAGSRRRSPPLRGFFGLEARTQSRLGDLELLGRRLRGRDPVLKLVPRPAERPRERVVGVALHPGEDLRRGGKRSDGRRRARGGAEALWRPRREDVAGRCRREQRADEVRAAALVLPRALDAVLVRADGDVLGPVVGGDGAFAEREQRGRNADQSADELLRRGAER